MSMAEATAAPIGLDPDKSDVQSVHDEREFGFWLFLMCDALCFALLFANHGVLASGRAGGPGPDDIWMPWTVAAISVLVVGASTLGGLAKVWSLDAKRPSRGGPILGAVAALAFAAALLFATGAWQLWQLIEMGAGPARSGYLSSVHAVLDMVAFHALLGAIWAATLATQLWIDGCTDDIASRVKRLGNFWHLLALLWAMTVLFVFLFGLGTGTTGSGIGS